MNTPIEAREERVRTNFINSFEPVILVETVMANEDSARGNNYSVFATGDESPPVGIMSGELEALHAREGGVLITLDNKAVAKDKLKVGTLYTVNQKIKIGRKAGGDLYQTAA